MLLEQLNEIDFLFLEYLVVVYFYRKLKERLFLRVLNKVFISFKPQWYTVSFVQEGFRRRSQAAQGSFFREINCTYYFADEPLTSIKVAELHSNYRQNRDS